MDVSYPPKKRRKLEEPEVSNNSDSEDDENVNYSNFLKPREQREPRVGDGFQASIPSITQPHFAQNSNEVEMQQEITQSREGDFSQFLQHKVEKKTRVGDEFQANIPSIEPNSFSNSNINS